MTIITMKSITFVGPSTEKETVATLHDDIYPADPQTPSGWPKWRRIVTATREGVAIIYTSHEAIA